MAFDFSKLWIPIMDPKGLDSVVSEHFGQAPNHLVLDVGNSEFEILEKHNKCVVESYGHCLPVDWLIERGVSMIACKGIGEETLSRMNVRGIRVYSACSTTVRGVLQQYNATGLKLISRQELCLGQPH